MASEIQARWQRFMAGISRYHAHPYARPPARQPVIWQDGTTRLYDYGETGTAGAPLFIIPSLVNRAYILDLMPDKSFIRFLAQSGFHPYLLDWDTPGAAEQDFDLSDYVLRRLLPAYEFIAACHPRPPAVLGYCMGGTLALALAQLAVQKPAALALLAAPWDFHAAGMPRIPADRAAELFHLTNNNQPMPADVLQSFFAGIDPFGAVQKFMKFAEMDAQSDAAELFVALEDWLSDGVPLTARVARETLQSWYGDNATARGRWHVAGNAINPAALTIPALAVLPQQDRIVSPASAAELAAAIPGALSLTPDMGHIGMMASRDAPARVWQPLVKWLKERMNG